MITLSDFDPEIIARYRITPRRLEQALHYVRLMGEWGRLTLRDIAVGGYYGTAALSHEIVELDILLQRDPRLLFRSRAEAVAFFARHMDAHTQALIAEYTYLQDRIRAVFGANVATGALILANASADDFYLVAESDFPQPLFWPDDEQVEEAAIWLDRLRRLGKEMP